MSPCTVILSRRTISSISRHLARVTYRVWHVKGTHQIFDKWIQITLLSTCQSSRCSICLGNWPDPSIQPPKEGIIISNFKMKKPNLRVEAVCPKPWGTKQQRSNTSPWPFIPQTHMHHRASAPCAVKHTEDEQDPTLAVEDQLLLDER